MEGESVVATPTTTRIYIYLHYYYYYFNSCENIFYSLE